MKEFKVTFKSQGKSIKVAQGTDLLTAAIKCGIILTASCGGEGLCGKCKVIIDKKSILACETIVESDLTVTVPKESIETHAKAGGGCEEFTKGIVLKREDVFEFSPLVRKVYLGLPKPGPSEDISDLDRVVEGISGKIGHPFISTRLASMKHLGEVLRESDFCVTAVLAYKDGALEIVAIEPGNTTAANFGFAFDIGTTTVVGQLIDMNTKEIIGTRIAFNRQASYGADVITRIIYASNAQGLKTLNAAILNNINEMIDEMAAVYKVNLSDVWAITCAGNMTMMHLLLSIDPSNIRKPPYTPTTVTFPTMHSSEIGIEASPKGIASFLPGVSTYIGGDIVAGVLACGLYDSDETELLADIGTNGEIVLGNKEWMIGSAASAGPAFEGSGLACGMKAVNGAIDKVEISGGLDVKISTIAGTAPKGICGSGYIDLLCQMLKRGVISKDGRINRDMNSKRIRKTETNYEFVIVPKRESATGRDIVIQEDDIDNLKRSKAALYSAMIALLNKVEKNTNDIKKIYIAGGFGNYLNIENAVYIGLLPDIDRKVYEFIGNSSLAGARMALLSHDASKKAYEIYKNITYVDLSSEPNYMDEYVASLFFPHTDIGRFPSVRS